ncbi:sugar transporter [Pasteurellaceae bacterium LIM206]|nr:sugar transporter [Pasteurellaceae bacterium LIM206]
MKDHKVAQRIAYFRVMTMAFAAFIFNTTEYIPVALLSDIAQSFDMTVDSTGWMITIYAWVVSLMSLPFMLLTVKLERRSLLIKLFILFIASHVLSVFAWNYWILLLSRIGIAFSHAVFWSITSALTIRIAPKGKQTQALGLLAMGSALAMVLGLPLGRVIGQLFGWRTTFAIIGIIAFVVMLVLARLLPHLPSKNSGSLASVPLLLKRPILIGIYAITVIMVSAHFTAYSYIEPFMLNIGNMSAETATAALFVFGLSGITASLLFGRLYRLGPAKFLVSMMILLTGSLFLLLPLSHNAFFMFLLIFIWGIGISGIGLSLQMRVLQLAPDATDVAMSMFSGIYNIGIGGGALIGGQVMKFLGLSGIGFVGMVLGGIGTLMFIRLHMKYRHLAIKGIK